MDDTDRLDLVARVRAQARLDAIRLGPAAPVALDELGLEPGLLRKRVEGAAKAMATGADVKNKASLANPECLDEYATLDGRSAL